MSWNEAVSISKASKEADAKFRELVLRRDRVCKRCRRALSTDCSHHFKRDNYGTRFDPRNGDGACRSCHDWWGDHWTAYVEWKKQQLGVLEYVELQRLSVMSVPREVAIKRFMNPIHEKASRKG